MHYFIAVDQISPEVVEHIAACMRPMTQFFPYPGTGPISAGSLANVLSGHAEFGLSQVAVRDRVELIMEAIASRWLSIAKDLGSEAPSVLRGVMPPEIASRSVSGTDRDEEEALPFPRAG